MKFLVNAGVEISLPPMRARKDVQFSKQTEQHTIHLTDDLS
jgi:hypothetical protein